MLDTELKNKEFLRIVISATITLQNDFTDQWGQKKLKWPNECQCTKLMPWLAT